MRKIMNGKKFDGHRGIFVIKYTKTHKYSKKGEKPCMKISGG